MSRPEEVPAVCPHGVRWPHECKECEAETPQSVVDEWARREAAPTQDCRVRTTGRILATIDCDDCGRQIVIVVVVNAEGAVDDIAVGGISCVCGATYAFEVNKTGETTN